MFDLEEEGIYIPNTEVMRNYLEGLNYKLTPISVRDRKEPIKYNAICFSEWVEQFGRIKQTNKLYYCMNKPTLTEEQSLFVFDILHVCTDYGTFKEALQQYINSNPQPLD